MKASTIRPGQRIQIHKPAFRDASGHTIGAGKYHGKTGTVIGIALDGKDQPYKVGSEILINVLIDGQELKWPEWNQNLRAADYTKICPHCETEQTAGYRCQRCSGP